ncbi:hypothetical protein Tco_0059265 [Tanacetum coccineum]
MPTPINVSQALITRTKRVKKLEKKLKLKRRSAVVDSLEDEEASLHNEDSSKQGRMIEEIDEDENVNLVKSSKQGEAHDTVGHRMESDDTEVVDFSTASPQNDDDEVTLAETLVNIKMSATKDKGKAIMQESEPPKKLKKKEMIQIDYEEIDEVFVSFGGSSKGGKITGKGKIRTGKLDFKDVYFVKELKFNLFSVSQMCDKKNNVLFTDTECVVLSPDFKLTDESHVLLKVPRKDNMYSVDLKNVVPQGGLTCLFAKATPDESNL